MAAEAKETLSAMVEPVAKFFAETNDAALNDETATVPPEVRARFVCPPWRTCCVCRRLACACAHRVVAARRRSPRR